MSKVFSPSRPALAAIALVLAGPVLAQSAADPAAETRLRKLESEVSALQRTVFPGGDGKFFPQLQPGQTATTQPGTPASAPSTDMLARMDALEGQVARLTAQVEEDHNHIEKVDARLAALEGTKGGEAAGAAAAAPTAGATTSGNIAAMTGGASAPKPAPAATTGSPTATSASTTPAVHKGATPPAATKPAAPSAQRLAAVRAVVKPQTRDAGDDEYSYGYRLWEAKFYPEAEQQLKLFLNKYPKHARVSYARNLLGRAYLDDGNAREAGSWFLQNYKTDPKGDRAADSLLYLADVMRRLDQTDKGCVALKQFEGDFAKDAAGRLADQYKATKAGLKCN